MAGQLENRRALSDDDKECLLMHVAALKPRTSSFLNDLNEYQAGHGLSASSLRRTCHSKDSKHLFVQFHMPRPGAGACFTLERRRAS